MKPYDITVRVAHNLPGESELVSIKINSSFGIHNEDIAKDDFVAGDGRVNEHPFLSTMHIIFVREHNRLAKGSRKKVIFCNVPATKRGGGKGLTTKKK